MQVAWNLDRDNYFAWPTKRFLTNAIVMDVGDECHCCYAYLRARCRRGGPYRSHNDFIGDRKTGPDLDARMVEGGRLQVNGELETS